MNLIPDSPGTTPSYWCTWGIQNYSLSAAALGYPPDDPHPFEGMLSFHFAMHNLNERLLFEEPGWASQYFAPVRGDLYVLFDVGWDLPYDVRYPDELWRFGALEVDVARFPSCAGTPIERLRKLNQRVQAHGWRGVGLWIAPQVPGDNQDGTLRDDAFVEAYWRERARWSHEAGIEYWKVDIGARASSATFRYLLTQIASEEAPGLRVEHGRGVGPLNDVPVPWEQLDCSRQGHFRTWGTVFQETLDLLAFSDVLRTYDVTPQLSVATTLERVAQILSGGAATGARGLLNCEDEPYLGAALGSALGIMRHPLWQPRPRMDYNPTHVHQRIDEVTRAVRWQRLMPAFGVKEARVSLDDTALVDSWCFEPGETWADFVIGQDIAQAAPARVTRGIELPEVCAQGTPPFVVASRHPNGAVAIATLPRTTSGRNIRTPPADVTLHVGSVAGPIGIFGHYQTLTLQFDAPLGTCRVWGQDLASNEAFDLTDQVAVHDQQLVLDSQLIHDVGTSAGMPGDRSEPGMVLEIRRSS